MFPDLCNKLSLNKVTCFCLVKVQGCVLVIKIPNKVCTCTNKNITKFTEKKYY